MTSASGDLDLDGLLGEEPFVRSLAKSLLFDEHQVDDVVQQTWIEALKVARGSRSWLASVVRSRACNLRRDAARRTAREASAARLEALPSASELLEREELRRHVVRAVSELPEKYRVVVLLRFYEGLPPRQIAEALEMPRNTVATRLKRGLQLLRESLDASHDGDRQQWAIGLVPLALPLAPKGAAAAFVASAAAWMWAMKYLVVTVVGLATLLFGSGLATDWFVGSPAGPDRTAVGAQVVADETRAVRGPVDNVKGPERSRAEVLSPAADGARPESVRAALCGFRGRLVAPDGSPAAGELVRLLGVDPVHAIGSVFDPEGRAGSRLPAGPDSHSVRSEEDGTFLIAGVYPNALHALHAGVDGDAPTWRLLTRTAGPSEIVDLGTITLAPKGTIVGRVVDENDEPVVGAEVWSADLPGSLMSIAPIDRLRPGGAAFVAVPTMSFGEAEPDAMAVFHSKLRKHFANHVTPSNDDTQFVSLDLPAWFARCYSELPIARSTSGSDGAFTLRGVNAGSSTLVVHADRYVNGGKKRVLVRAGASRDVGDLRLKRGNVCCGAVRDSFDNPVTSARVRVAERPRFGLTGILFAGREHTVDGSGRFEVSGLGRDELFVAVQREQGQPWHVHGPFDVGDEDIALVLRAAEDVALRLTSAAALEPLQNVKVTVRRGPPLGELTVLGMQPAVDVEFSTSEHGVTVHALDAGHYTLQISADGHAVQLLAIEVAPGDLEHSVSLQPLARTTLHVVDTVGTAVVGAQVFVQPTIAAAWGRSVLFGFGEVRGWQQLARFAGFTDEAGALVVDVLPAGEATICVRHPAFGAGTCRVALPADHTNVRLQPTGAVFGKLTDGGLPALADKHRLVANPIGASSPMPRVGAQATVAPDGSFRFVGLTAGRYEIAVEDSLDGIQSLGGVLKNVTLGVPWGGRERRRVEVRVEPGGEHEVLFDVDERRSVAGGVGFLRVSASIDGIPAKGYRVMRGYLVPESIGTIDAAGGCLSSALAPRTYTFVLHGPTPGIPLWRGEATILAKQETLIEIALQSSVVRGRVLLADGSPASHYVVDLDGVLAGGGAYEASVRTDASGRYELRALAGGYELSCAGPKGSARLDLVAVAGGCVAPDLLLSASGVFAGRVDAGNYEVGFIGLMKGKKSQVVALSAGGTFVFAGLQPGEYAVSFTSKKWAQHSAIPPVIRIDSHGLIDQVIRVGPRE